MLPGACKKKRERQRVDHADRALGASRIVGRRRRRPRPYSFVMAITAFQLKVESKGRSLEELSEGHVMSELLHSELPEAATRPRSGGHRFVATSRYSTNVSWWSSHHCAISRRVANHTSPAPRACSMTPRSAPIRAGCPIILGCSPMDIIFG